MTSLAWVEESAKGIEEAVEAREWDTADRALQYFIGAWQRARIKGDASAALASRLDELRGKLVVDHDISQQVGPVQFAWMLAAISSVLTQAVTPPELVGGGIADRILAALAADDRPMSTGELAERIERSVEATARELPRLRALGMTTGTSAGRQMLNGITAAGKARSERLRAETSIPGGDSSSRADTSMPSSVVRPEYVDLRSNDADATRQP